MAPLSKMCRQTTNGFLDKYSNTWHCIASAHEQSHAVLTHAYADSAEPLGDPQSAPPSAVEISCSFNTTNAARHSSRPFPQCASAANRKDGSESSSYSQYNLLNCFFFLLPLLCLTSLWHAPRRTPVPQNLPTSRVSPWRPLLMKQ